MRFLQEILRRETIRRRNHPGFVPCHIAYVLQPGGLRVYSVESTILTALFIAFASFVFSIPSHLGFNRNCRNHWYLGSKLLKGPL